MDYVQLGATGLNVSVAGLGGGGSSTLGLQGGRSEADVVALIRLALDLGVNLIDTAEAYGTEPVIGKALKSVRRDAVTLVTKTQPAEKGERRSAAAIVAALDNSLRQLGVDYVDVFMVHGLTMPYYDFALNEVLPALLKEKAKGKFRHIGFSESSPIDFAHETALRGAADGPWEVMMLGFHMMHQNARQKLFPLTMKKRIGTLMMFAVRAIFSQPKRLRKAVADLVAKGELPPEMADRENPLDFLVHEGGASSVSDAAYRFVRHEPGADVVLFGTGNPEHLKQNIASLLKPPLPQADRDKIAKLFGHLVGVGLDFPARNAHAIPMQPASPAGPS